MNEFLYIFHNGDTSKLSAEQMQGMTGKWMTWIGQIAQEGKLKDRGNRLEATGSIVKKGGAVTDGPFADGKEIIGGYTIVQTNSLREATELAHGCPIFEVGGHVEVRPIAPM